MCGTCGVCECGDGTASDRPVLLLPRQRVWEGGISGDRLFHLLLRRPRLTNRLPLSVQPRSDRRARFTYANGMEMTQTRGHADRFLFSSWAKSQSGASFGHSAGILPHYIIWTVMPDLWHVSRPNSRGKRRCQQHSAATVMVHVRVCSRTLQQTISEHGLSGHLV